MQENEGGILTELDEPAEPSVTPAGFTLIELMVVLAVIGILGSIVYPSYLEYVRKAKRSEARAALMQLMQQQERFYSQRNTYISFSSTSTEADAKRFKWFSGGSAAASAYEIAGSACSGTDLTECIELVATPGTNNVDPNYRDPKCGKLSVTSTGLQAADGDGCWR